MQREVEGIRGVREGKMHREWHKVADTSCGWLLLCVEHTQHCYAMQYDEIRVIRWMERYSKVCYDMT